MKKFLTFLLVAALFTACLPTVFAAGNASLKGPDAVRAGDTITLTFSVSGDNISGVQGSVSYDESQLTLNSYTPSLKSGWDGEFNGNKFAFFDNNLTAPISGSASFFKASFTVKVLEPGTEISVSVNGIKLSSKSEDGYQDTNLGSKTYQATILPPLSDNCTLADLTVSNASISPAFSPEVTSYSASVPFTTSSLQVEAAAEHPGAKVTIKNTSLTAGDTTTVKVIVKAENGAEKTYSIRVKRAQDPNYVPSSNAVLQDLTVEGFQLSPAFSPDVNAYYVWLPYEAEALNLTASAADEKASVTIGEAALEAGKATAIPVTVTAEDGTTMVYTVTAVRAPAHADAQDFLDARIPVSTEPEPTEPETLPAPQSAEPAPQPVMDGKTQIVILAGACAACLLLGLLLGVLLFRKNDSYVVAPEPEEESDEFSDDMPAFDLRDDPE